ncbi:MAG: rhodanese-like domain-containing protein [Actinomycetota bacterium]
MSDDDRKAQPLRTQVHLARAVAENLRPADLAAELADSADEGLLLIDVRERDEAAAGVIDGAVVIPRGTIEFAIGLAAERRVVVYCSTGERSALVMRTLYGLGHHDVARLEGGVDAWLSDGRRLVPWTSDQRPSLGAGEHRG